MYPCSCSPRQILKEFLLSQIPDTWRKEVGDFPYDMIMPDVAQVMQLEIAQDRTLQNAFPQFCEDERMDEHMEIRGLTRIEATANKRVLSIVADPGVRTPTGLHLYFRRYRRRREPDRVYRRS